MRRTRSLSRPAIRLGGALVACVLAGGAAFAQTTYKKPPREVVRMLETPPPPIVSVGPTGERAILLGRESMRSIEELAAPMLRLAGERINPVTNAPHMSYWSFVSMERLDLDAGRTTTIDTPEEAKIDSPSWAPDGSMIAFRATFPDRAELWVVDVDEARARRVGGFDLNSAITTGFEWMPDSETLLVATVPSGRGAPPEEADAPTGPVIQETSGRTSPVRTYQDLLEDEHDERLFEYYATAQLALVNALTGSTRPIGEPGLYRDYEPAPDGRHILTTRMLRPFSYLVPHWSFPDVVEVTDLKDGDRTVIARRPLRDQTPIGGVPTGRRSIEWKATSPATLMWAEALDGGDPKVEVPHRDALLTLSAPFTDAPTEFMRTEQRYVDRARYILEAAEGEATTAIAEHYDVRPATVSKWRVRFSEQRFEGLQDAPRSGTKATYGPRDEQAILAKLDEDPPRGYATWNGRLLVLYMNPFFLLRHSLPGLGYL